MYMIYKYAYIYTHIFIYTYVDLSSYLYSSLSHCHPLITVITVSALYNYNDSQPPTPISPPSKLTLTFATRAIFLKYKSTPKTYIAIYFI